MKKIDIRKAPSPLQDYLRNLGEEPVILTVGRKPIGVLLPVRDADLETVSLSLNPKFLAILEKSKRSYYEKGGISSEELRQNLGIPPLSDRHRATVNGKPKTKRRKRKLAQSKS